MEIFVSIDGVLRNTIQKFDYHYKDYFLNTETDEEEKFDYGVNGVPISIENLLSTYKFQSIDEFNKFLYFDFPIEIYGHAGLSYNQAATELNTFIFENKNAKITLVGLSEKGKAKPATLINKLSEINKTWLKFSVKTIISMLMESVTNVKRVIKSKMKTEPQH